MELMTSYLIPFLTVIILLLTRIYFVLPKHIKVLNKTKRTKPCKTCIVLGSGGHTAEMLQLIKSLDPERYTPRSYIVANTDKLSEEKAIEYEQSLIKGSFDIYKIPRARKVGQSMSSVPWTMLLALLTCTKVLIQSWPDLILCNGPGSCIPICMLAYIPRVVGIKKIEIIYIESFARVDTLSLSGKLLYPFVDRFLVQWPELSQRLNKAEYFGILV
ncbi:UDP-N-acetylglucosamine transferase subunit alg14 [Pilaira anomala]|nr:UDP-N-acetylglucosamine transferase subunit alg14 [Pilaira anomala]